MQDRSQAHCPVIVLCSLPTSRIVRATASTEDSASQHSPQEEPYTCGMCSPSVQTTSFHPRREPSRGTVITHMLPERTQTSRGYPTCPPKPQWGCFQSQAVWPHSCPQCHSTVPPSTPKGWQSLTHHFEKEREREAIEQVSRFCVCVF